MLTLPSPENPEVSIIIVTARQAERLLRCLEAVVAGTEGAPPYEVVIVLNAAEPALAERLGDAATGARVIESNVPLGLAGGAHLGAAHARGHLLHLLHDDTVVSPGWLGALTAALDRHPEAGAVGSLVLELNGDLDRDGDPDRGVDRVQTAGNVLWRDGTTTPRWSGDPPALGSFSESYPVDYCATASLLIRREAWEAAGGFDERFHPAYYVDVDFAMSLRACGYTVICEPASRVRHERGGSSGEAFRTFVSGRNRELFCSKWSSDLRYQEPPGADDEALQRAFGATERRAAAVRGDGVRPIAKPTDTPLYPESELSRLRRERGLLVRDLEVKDAFLEFAERRIAELAEQLQAQATEALSTRQQLEAELEELRRRAVTLQAIQDGGWWRLRARLLWLLRLGRRARVFMRHRV